MIVLFCLVIVKVETLRHLPPYIEQLQGKYMGWEV